MCVGGGVMHVRGEGCRGRDDACVEGGMMYVCVEG